MHFERDSNMADEKKNKFEESSGVERNWNT